MTFMISPILLRPNSSRGALFFPFITILFFTTIFSRYSLYIPVSPLFTLIPALFTFHRLLSRFLPTLSSLLPSPLLSLPFFLFHLIFLLLNFICLDFFVFPSFIASFICLLIVLTRHNLHFRICTDISATFRKYFMCLPSESLTNLIDITLLVHY